MKDSILLIDDEPHILSAIKRIFDDDEVQVFTATAALEGLKILAQEEIAVLVTDNMMPEVDGLEVLRRARDISPDTVRIMLTGHANIDTAIDAINFGEVFRFILKPWNNAILAGTVNEARQRHKIIKDLRSGDEGVMLSIAQTIELKDSYTRGHCDRVAQYAQMIGEELGLPTSMLKEIKYGSWLHDCGKIGVAESVLNSPSSLNKDEYMTMKNHSLWGAEVARLAHLSERVINIIQYHHEHYDGSGYPRGLKGDAIPLEARIVSVADAYDALISDRPYRKAHTREEGLRIITTASGKQFDAMIVESFLKRLATEKELPSKQ